MLRNLTITAVTALAFAASAAFAAGGGEQHIEDYAFSFEGPFGKFDQNQLQRGLKVYTEVCAACHGLRYVPIRTLADEGGPHFTSDQVRAYATNFEVYDADLKARAGFHGPYGTGISQLINGMGGPEYIASLLTGYTGEEKEEAGVTLYENTAFPGGWISMAPPLYGEDVDYDDGHANDIEHEAMDVAAFLMWTAEPKMMARQHAGFVGVLMLSLLAALLYLTNKRIWAPIKKKSKQA